MGEFKGLFSADTTGAESAIGAFKKGFAGCVVNKNEVFVGKHYFYQSHRVIGSGGLAKLIGKIATGVFRPLDFILVNRFSGAIDDFDVAVL